LTFSETDPPKAASHCGSADLEKRCLRTGKQPLKSRGDDPQQLSAKKRLTKFELALRSPGRTEEMTMLKIALHSDITAAARRLQRQSYPWAMPCVVNSLFSDISSESGIGSEK